MKKVTKIVFLIALLIICSSSITFAKSSPEDYQTFKIATTEDTTLIELETMDTHPEVGNTSQQVGSVVNSIVVMTQIVGTAVAVIILLVLAMKYMTASPGDKADIKKSALTYLVGAIVVFGVPNILKIILKFAGAIK